MQPKCRRHRNLKKGAWEEWKKLRHRASHTQPKNDYWKRFLAISKVVLDAHPLPESSDTAQAVIDKQEAIVETLRDSLNPPHVLFDESFYNNAFYPVKLLFDVSSFYVVEKIEDNEWYVEFALSTVDERSNTVCIISWLCWYPNMLPMEERIVVDDYQASRSYFSHRLASASDKSSPAIAENEPVDQERSASGTGAMSVNQPSIRHGTTRNLSRDLTQFDRMKQSNNVNSYFYGKQFGGELTQSIDLTLQEYRRRGLLFHTNFASALTGNARVFFMRMIRPGMTLADVEGFMVKHCNGGSRQVVSERSPLYRKAVYLASTKQESVTYASTDTNLGKRGTDAMKDKLEVACTTESNTVPAVRTLLVNFYPLSSRLTLKNSTKVMMS